MAMSIHTNFTGLQSQRSLANNSAALNKNIQALSSGFRINSAADDAAFDARLRKGRFQVRAHHVKARRTKGPRRTIWIAMAT